MCTTRKYVEMNCKICGVLSRARKTARDGLHIYRITQYIQYIFESVENNIDRQEKERKKKIKKVLSPIKNHNINNV